MRAVWVGVAILVAASAARACRGAGGAWGGGPGRRGIAIRMARRNIVRDNILPAPHTEQPGGRRAGLREPRFRISSGGTAPRSNCRKLSTSSVERTDFQGMFLFAGPGCFAGLRLFRHGRGVTRIER